MSLASLRQILLEKLGERDARRFQDVHLQNLLDKEYIDESALQDATREGLQTQPALPAALVDKLLKAFGQSGPSAPMNKYGFHGQDDQTLASSDDFKQVMAALEPIRKVCLEKLSQTRCASQMNKDDLRNVRKAFRTILQVKDAESNAFVKEEEFWNGRYEVEKAADYLRTINIWAQVGRGLKFRDARGHVLREADTLLKFPISGSNDVVLALRQYVSELELGAFMGIELKRGLTPKGLRQAEVEYYLWAGCSMFPFVQIITDMQVGGAAFFRTGSSRAGNNIVMQFLHGMDSVRDFVKNVVASIPDDAGEDANGIMKIPPSLENPSRKRHREDTPEPGSDARGGSFQGGHMPGYQRGYELIAAMQPDAGNELLGDLDDFAVNSWTNDEDRNALIIPVS